MLTRTRCQLTHSHSSLRAVTTVADTFSSCNWGFHATLIAKCRPLLGRTPHGDHYSFPLAIFILEVNFLKNLASSLALDEEGDVTSSGFISPSKARRFLERAVLEFEFGSKWTACRVLGAAAFFETSFVGCVLIVENPLRDEVVSSVGSRLGCATTVANKAVVDAKFAWPSEK